MRQRLVRKMGTFYWQTIPQKEFEKIVDSLIIDLKGENIKNEDDLADFVAKEVANKEPLNLPQWRVYIKTDFQ